MDVEARRKFCGLLMFDIPTISDKSQTSRNNDIIINNMSTQEVDTSSSNRNSFYESSRNASSLMNSTDQQFIMQDGFSQSGDFSTTTRALAAGAAAGDDLTNPDSSNATDGDTKSQPPKRTPRPPNAFILYRREKQPAIIASQRSLTNAEVSRTISDMWRKEPEDTRLKWERYADMKKLEHMQTYPNYVYRPNKNKSKVDKRRQNRKQSTKDSSTNVSNDPSNSENKTTGTNAIARRKSTKSASRLPSKLDMPLSMNNGMTGFNMQPQSSSISPMNQQHPPSAISISRTDTMNSTSSYSTILPSPEMPLLTTHFTDSPEDYVTSHSQFTPLTPNTPLTPISTPEQMQIREHDFKIRQQQQFQNSLLHFVPEELNSINGLASFHHHPTNAFPHQTVDPLEFCLVPDVEQQQQQMMAEMMLHHEQHHITPTSTVPSSNNGSIHVASSIPVQYYPSGSNAAAALSGNHSFTEMLGFEFQNFLGENHHHNGNGLDVNTSDHYLQ
ncbi:14636_t:CDS:2 [Funneliformis geosporum]|uniref:9355_t:CDS:1 n=1 Tax=Funneliformis geosporum TaxID=1117311 RepID=A0A9W4SDZ6_9GLOM|nr:9355_t:CDS:2 [Funneliformis geosporum]CAI2167741.1 14636_t:CDS:2 [Funneliformis geosporum]